MIAGIIIGVCGTLVCFAFAILLGNWIMGNSKNKMEDNKE